MNDNKSFKFNLIISCLISLVGVCLKTLLFYSIYFLILGNFLLGFGILMSYLVAFKLIKQTSDEHANTMFGICYQFPQLIGGIIGSYIPVLFIDNEHYNERQIIYMYMFQASFVLFSTLLAFFTKDLNNINISIEIFDEEELININKNIKNDCIYYNLKN